MLEKKGIEKKKRNWRNSSFFNMGNQVIEADLISIANTRRAASHRDRKFENVRVFE